MLRKVLVVLMMVTISLGVLSGCKKSDEEKIEDKIDETKKEVEKVLE